MLDAIEQVAALYPAEVVNYYSPNYSGKESRIKKRRGDSFPRSVTVPPETQREPLWSCVSFLFLKLLFSDSPRAPGRRESPRRVVKTAFVFPALSFFFSSRPQSRTSKATARGCLCVAGLLALPLECLLALLSSFLHDEAV